MSNVRFEALVEDALNALSKLGEKIVRGAKSAATSACIETTNELKVAMQTSPPTGRTYRLGKTVFHVASSPGNPPRSRYGRAGLLGSFNYEVTTTGAEVSARVWSDREYAEYLEFGTSTMAPRPMWRPVRDKIATKYSDLVVSEVSREL